MTTITIPEHGGHDPDNMNSARVHWGYCTVKSFMQLTRADEDTALCDLLADLMHYADAHHGKGYFADQLERACQHFTEETNA